MPANTAIGSVRGTPQFRKQVQPRCFDESCRSLSYTGSSESSEETELRVDRSRIHQNPAAAHWCKPGIPVKPTIPNMNPARALVVNSHRLPATRPGFQPARSVRLRDRALWSGALRRRTGLGTSRRSHRCDRFSSCAGGSRLVGITCRNAGGDIRVIVKSNDLSIANRMRKADVNEVISPNQLSGERVCELIST